MLARIFNADRGFDAEYKLMMRANIKQRIMNDGRKRLYYRRRAMNEFDKSIYRWRGIIEAIFGAESNKNKLMTRFRKKENQERWGIIIAIGWNLKVLNRKMQEESWDGGEINNKELGDNLYLNRIINW